MECTIHTVVKSMYRETELLNTSDVNEFSVKETMMFLSIDRLILVQFLYVSLETLSFYDVQIYRIVTTNQFWH